MGLTTEEQILIEQRVTNSAKSPAAAYLLWFFVGWAGAHRFYLGRSGSGIAMLLLYVVGWLTTVFMIGFVMLGAWGIWWLVDLFLISGMIDAQKSEVRARLTQEALVGQRS
ncbi:TM2 domain-containing protein [Martelella soudanensis]|uniref:TM2 domain-containing protein n=1 Tax=unclassified Martelella TaxID=2629616 RepID=UPI0015E021B9|nr:MULTISPECIES: TM2 domain-containing protein [unclassified Martelella]